MIYQKLPRFTEEQTEDILKRNQPEELVLLAFSTGEYCRDWKGAQNICAQLTSHTDEDVRRAACYGFSYIARNHGKLDKEIVRPYLFNELRTNKKWYGDIVCCIKEINIYMKWRIAEKAIRKYQEQG